MRIRHDKGIRLFTGVIISLLVAVPCAAQQPGFQRYDNADGIPERQITSIFQDEDGVLWLGTYTGIIRFNGSWAEIIDTADGLPNASINCIAADERGRLCFGTQGGGLIIRDDDTWLQLTVSDGLPDSAVIALAKDYKGSLWVATRNGLVRIHNDVMQPYRWEVDVPFSYCYEIVADPANIVWFATDVGLVKLYGGVFSVIPFAAPPKDTDVISIALKGSHLWACADGQIFRLENQQLHFVLEMPPGDAQYVYSLTIDYASRLWIGTWIGAFVLEGDSLRHYSATSGLNSSVVNRILMDRDTNLWFATEGGLTRLSRGVFVFYDTETGLADNDVLHIVEDRNNRILVATAKGLSILDGDQWSTLTTADGLADNYVTCLAPRADGSMIIITDAAAHEWRDGRIRVLQRGLFTVCVFTDSRDRVWMGTNEGLYRLEGDRFVPHSTDPLLAGIYVNSIAEDLQGRIWIGTNRHGCLILDGLKIEVLDGSNGLTNLDIWCVRRDREGAMWLGTNGAGAFRWRDGVLHNYSRREGLVSDFIWQVLPDSRGGVWFGTNQGTILLAGDRMTHFTRDAGLAADEGTQDVCLEDSQGRIWFGSNKGLSRVNRYPETDQTHSVPIRIEHVLLDDRRIAQDEAIVVTPENRSLLLRFAGIAYVDSKRLLYRYRLVGRSEGWSYRGNNNDVQFSELGPGDYIFEVQASIDDGNTWSAKPATLAIKVEPRYYQTWWFLTLCITCVLAAFYAGHSYRLRQERLATSRLERIVSEKTAELQARNEQLQASVQDLEAFTHMVSHDLRAPLTRIKGFLNLLKTTTDLPADSEAVTYIARVQSNCSRMDEMIRDLLRFSRSSRQPIQLEDVDLGLLARDIARSLQQAEEGRRVEFRFPEKLIVRSDARLIRIVLENLLNNAWKYSSKRELAVIEMDCSTGSTGERICFVRDNGVGFDQTRKDQLFALFSRLHDTADFSGLGLGLVTAQKIINRLGGRIWAESEGEEGATFYFSLP